MNVNFELKSLFTDIKTTNDTVTTAPTDMPKILIAMANQIASFATQLADIDSERSQSVTNNPVAARKWLRQIIKIRRSRDKFLPTMLFADPGWDILLDLTLARLENRPISVSSLCIAASVPSTTALRWIKNMMDYGIIQRIPDPLDRRRHHVALSETIFCKMLELIDHAR